jgi:SAM-dependent methyltransferase
MNDMKTFLHVGCGKSTKEDVKGFSDWNEIRYDIDKNVKPDVVGSITDLSVIGDSSVDAVFSSHNIEHIYAHEVIGVLSEFRRVLNDDGFLLITCPDLQKACELVIEQGLLSVAYDSPSGPISPIDMIYGYRPFVEHNDYMLHKCGFTDQSLASCFYESGFAQIHGGRHGFDLWFIAFKRRQDDMVVSNLLNKHIP